MRWAGHVARLGEERIVYKVFGGSQKERDHSEGQGKIESEWILWSSVGGVN
jgi:hypothetical protein